MSSGKPVSLLYPYDYYFDTINHPVLFQKLMQLSIPSNISCCGYLTFYLVELKLFLHSGTPLAGYQ